MKMYILTGCGVPRATVLLLWQLLLLLVVAVAGPGQVAAGRIPPYVLRGDLCKRMDGRKYYLEPGTHALVTATNVTLPVAFPRLVATRGISHMSQASLAPTTDAPGYKSSPTGESVPAPAESSGPSAAQFPGPHSRHRRELALKVEAQEEAFFTLSSQEKSESLSTTAAPFLSTTTTTTTTAATATTTTTTAATATTTHITTTTLPQLAESDIASTRMDVQAAREVRSGGRGGEYRCGTEFFTCRECHLEFTFTKVNLPSCSHDLSCRCDYLRVREPPYVGSGGDGEGRDVCSSGDEPPSTFTTQTREGVLHFLYSNTYTHAFTISVAAKRNKYHILGKINMTQGYIRSPFFPELYPKEHWMEYQLEADEPNALIKVNFLDFFLSPWSFVEVQDSFKARVAVFNGNLFRPPILVSSGSSLTIRFSSNGETARGFNLHYSFIDKESIAAYPAITDCGGFVTNFGGTITMMNMTKGDSNLTMYDCVWILQPPQNYAFKSHLSIRVVQFEDMVPGTQLQIRQGVTSEDYLLDTVRVGSIGEGTSGKEHVAAIDTGFYVRLRGAFTRDSKLAIAYTSFSYLGSCYTLTDLMCHNHRCIPKMLRCDGFDHCGDGSDEPASCYAPGPGNKTLTPEDAAWWYHNTPNYYFPLQKNPFMGGGYHGWSTLLLLASLVVMAIVVFGLISHMVKVSQPTTSQRERRSAGHSRRASLSDGVEIFDASADDPPLYEAPPDYEEVIKVILSGNNLKLVRRPGGVTAWVPDKLANEGGESPGTNDRPLRTRHASLDLEQGMEVVLWNPNAAFTTPRGRMGTNDNGNEPLNKLAAHFPLGHMRRSSLPVAPLPEMVQGRAVHGHSVSVAPETIAEAPEGTDSPQILSRPLSRAFPTLSSPHLSESSFMSGDTSAAPTPGPSTPQNLRVATLSRKSKRFTKKGGKRKKKPSSARRSERKANKDEDSAPPSYEMAMQQASTPLPGTPLPGETPSTSTASSQVNESTQTNDTTQEPSPTDRVKAAREMFQQISKSNRSETEESTQTSVVKKTAKRSSAPFFKAKLTRTSSSGGTISRGTVKARKAMLLKAQKPFSDCSCSGACSCAHFKTDTSSSSSENLNTGGVKSIVNYYLTIEENTKKRDRDTSSSKSVTESKNSETKKPEDFSNTDVNNKKRRLVRNQSAPSFDISHLTNEVPIAAASSMEDMERPLITPDTEYPRPVLIPCQSPVSGGEESSDEKVISSIKNRVHLYNQLSKSPGSSPAIIRRPVSPAPCHGAMTPEQVKPNTTEASDMNFMKHVKASTSDANMKPGLVKEARSKFVTALNHEIRPKLHLQDSDDWNDGSDSPLPINIPYLNLRNEEVGSPDITDTDRLTIPPLKQDEAESIERWDSESRGKPVSWREEEQEKLFTENLPPSLSGAVPKKPIAMSKVSVKNAEFQTKENHKGKSVVVQLTGQRQVKGAEEKNHRGGLSAKYNSREEYGEPQPCSSVTLNRPKTLAMNLGKQASQSSMEDSEDEYILSPQRKVHCKILDETLNETLDSDSDDSYEDTPQYEVNTRSGPKISPVTSQSCSGSYVGSQPNNTVKIPIPCPRGSKATGVPPTGMVERTSSPALPDHPTSSAVLPSSLPSGCPQQCTSPSSSISSPVPSSPGSLREAANQSPTLSPQMVRSGIVTIQTGRRLKWDYI